MEKIERNLNSVAIIILFTLAKCFVDNIVIPLISYGIDLLGVIDIRYLTNYHILFYVLYTTIYVYFIVRVAKKSSFNFLIWLLSDIISIMIYDDILGVDYYPNEYFLGGSRSIIWPGYMDGWYALILVIQAITLFIATIVRIIRAIKNDSIDESANARIPE